MAEAEGEDTEGKALVILVVLNRVGSDEFPDTIEDVIYQPRQFSPVSNGRFDRVEPDEDCWKALAMIEVEGWDESMGATYFESKSESEWHEENLFFLFQYGSHYFYTDKELVKMDSNLFGDVESATAFAIQTTKAMEAAGRSTAEVSTMQTQLNNVLAKGEMNAMTFARMLKTYPEMINYIGEGLGKTTDELAAMADAGQLTSETIVKAFGAASDKIDKDFGELDFHISDAITNIRNKWGLFVDQVWVGSGIANDFAHMMVDGFDVFLDVLKTLQPYITKGIRFLIRGLQQVSAIVKRLQPAMERFTSSMRNGINKAVGVVKIIVDKLGGMEHAMKLLAIVAAAFFVVMNWNKIISGAKTFMSMISSIGKLFSRGCKKFCVYGEIIFTDRNQICKNLLSNSITFMLSNSFSDNSIANPLSFIHDFWFFCMPIRH